MITENLIKFIEIRDRATCISVMVIHICDWDRETIDFSAYGKIANAHFRHCGYGGNDRNYFLYVPLEDVEKTTYDKFRYRDRTFFNAYSYIENNWDSIKSGDIVDVRVILNEADSIPDSDIF